GLLGLVAIGRQAREQVDEEIEGAAVARVLDLADVFELIDDGLDQGAFAQQEPVGEVEELVAHVLAQFGDQAESVDDQETFSERRRDVALVAKVATDEMSYQARNWPSIVGVAGSETEGEQLTAVIDDEMEFEAIEPADRSLAAPGIDG